MKITVVKIGGNVIDNEQELVAFLADFAAMDGPKVLVHGGGKLATRLSDRLGIDTQMIDGRRVTSRETLDVVTMVYGGLVSKQIVARLQALGCNAIGLSGADANLIPATRREPNPVDYGYVGDIYPKDINVSTLKLFLEQGLTPVFCALCHENGTLLNCNADTIAQSLAVALTSVAQVDLIYCFEQPGVMRDVNDASSLIAELTPESYARLRAEGVIYKGMIPKLDNAFAAIRKGVSTVTIKHSRNLRQPLGTKLSADEPS